MVRASAFVTIAAGLASIQRGKGEPCSQRTGWTCQYCRPLYFFVASTTPIPFNGIRSGQCPYSNVTSERPKSCITNPFSLYWTDNVVHLNHSISVLYCQLSDDK